MAADRESAYRIPYVKPRAGNWKRVGYDENSEGWLYVNPIRVLAISSIHMVDGKPQWHVSFSQAGMRIPNGHMPALLSQWGLELWDEDNHVPDGNVRNFWKPVVATDPQVCACKANEEPHEEEGGYIWRPDLER